ncbi:beta-N-acetylhexosaminidase [Marinilabiliaceae bacterium JC017]|nr:beta-N-acetylhexosaminidase [Marinilabiliaceae bacterium JC017]
MKKSLLIVLAICLSMAGWGQPGKQEVTSPFYEGLNSQWVDSVYQSLSLDEQIAQLFWVTVYADGNPVNQTRATNLIKKYHPGGIIFFKSTPAKMIAMSNYLQSLSKVPLVVSIDGEWGLGMRLDSTISFPYQMTLGALENDSLIYCMGREIGRQMKRVGIHVNLAPVVDVNNNPNNPVIGKRSFGENAFNVARNSLAYMQGLQDEHIIAVAKHFPGHGDTEVDSHKGLPKITHDRQRLEGVDIFPYKILIEKGLTGVMTGHLEVPALETQKGVPASLSASIIKDILKDELKFQGLVITDAMNMRGVKIAGKPGVVDARALIAGNDIIEFTEDLGKAIAQVKLALKQGTITSTEIETKCRKALAAKYWCGLTQYQPVSLNNLEGDINTPTAECLKRQLYEQSLTVLKNDKNLLPFKELDKYQSAVVTLGRKSNIDQFVNRYEEIPHIHAGKVSDAEAFLKKTAAYNRFIVVVERASDVSRSANLQKIFNSLINKENCVVVYMDNPYKLKTLGAVNKATSLILTYECNETTRDLATQLIYGGIGASGRLPVSIGTIFSAGDGVNVKGLGRLKYTMGEELGLDSRYIIPRVDSIALQGIAEGAFPGCCVLVAKDGNVIFNKGYGFHTYDNKIATTNTDIFDLASVTKITGPLPLIIKACDQGWIDPDKPFSTYWSDWQKGFLKRSNKAAITLREVLAHQAGLKPYLSYYSLSMKAGKYLPKYYKLSKEPGYSLEIDDHLYLADKFKKKIYKTIRKSAVEVPGHYKYSGLSFMIYPELLADFYGENYEEALYDNFYKPLGASTLRYNPMHSFSKNRIIPTEYDANFRHQWVHGHVHDEAAATLGGVSGNAGLFATANDLAKLMQMYLNGGEYGGEVFFSKPTMEAFTKVQFPEDGNRRGMGFDKPLFGNDTLSLAKAYPAPGVSAESFGHSGFTGTFVWMDPQTRLLYIFLSNRVYPSRDNRKIYELNIRPSIQQVFYDALNNRRKINN